MTWKMLYLVMAVRLQLTGKLELQGLCPNKMRSDGEIVSNRIRIHSQQNEFYL